MDLNTSTYLLKSVMISSTFALVLGIILFLFGGIILAKGLKCIKFTRGISGLWFFGYLTYLLGIVIIVNVSPSDPTTALWIVFGCTIGFSILGAILCGAIGILGDIILGAASGNFYVLMSCSFAIYITATIATFLVFGITSYLLYTSNFSTHQPVEKQEEA
ncbi:hypothetical protein K502DRAFT_351777 [Neoconidiobolus thromboides FSU 785]|nr:hypothetical protein K502DRAFT_351777 [Neoconidiobolus thromboides FSU 785]